jgi:hypothetical protein
MQINLLSDPLSLLAGLGIVLTLFSLFWTRNVWVLGAFLGCTLLLSVFSQRITALGLLWIGLLAGLSWVYFKDSLKTHFRIGVGLALVLLCLGISMHRLPGFHNWLLISDFYTSEDALPLRLYANFDKPWIGIFLLLWGCLPLHQDRFSIQKLGAFALTVTYLTAAACILLLRLSYVLGYVRFDWKWFDFSGLWLVINLFFACIAEEAFFRLLIQKTLSKIFPPRWKGGLLAWGVTAVLFGLLHFAGGWKYVILTTGAGFFYGYAYLVTQRVEASILIHFLVNTVHFLAFTYPALKGSL